MSAHLRELYARNCQCGRAAKVELFNTVNASLGYRCKRCGERELKEILKRNEEQSNEAPFARSMRRR